MCIFIPAFILLIFSIIKKTKIISNKRMTDKNFTIFIPNIVAIIGAILSIISAIILLSFTLFSDTIPHIIFYIVFGLFLWLGMYLVLKTLCFRLIIKDKVITSYSIFGKSYTFTFCDIISVVRQIKQNRVKSERMIIKTKHNKKIIVESTEISYFKFLNRIKSEVNTDFLHGFE